MWRRLVAEALGTFLFTLSIAVSHFNMFQIPGTYYSAYPVAGSIIMLLPMTGYVSGGHFNPAVTTGYIVRNVIFQKIEKSLIVEHVLYIIIQIFSAIPAAFLAAGLNRDTMYFDVADFASTADGFFAEIVYSALIVGVSLMLGRLNDSVVVGTIGIGIAYFGGILAVGLISGGCFNPAVALAVNLAHYSAHGTHMEITWMYFVAPLLGGAIAGVLNNIFLDELKSQKRSKVGPD